MRRPGDIAGVWIVAGAWRHAINLPLLYQRLRRPRQRDSLPGIEAAGFVAGIHWRQSRWADVAVIRAERRPGPVDHEHCA